MSEIAEEQENSENIAEPTAQDGGTKGGVGGVSGAQDTEQPADKPTEGTTKEQTDQEKKKAEPVEAQKPSDTAADEPDNTKQAPEEEKEEFVQEKLAGETIKEENPKESESKGLENNANEPKEEEVDPVPAKEKPVKDPENDAVSEENPPGTADSGKRGKRKRSLKPKSSSSREDGSKAIPKLKRKTSSRQMSRSMSIADTDLFDNTIKDMFQLADTKSKGYLNREDFINFLASDHMQDLLSETEKLQYLEYFEQIAPDGALIYEQFSPIAKQLILRVYQIRDTSTSEWIQLSMSSGEVFWLNKQTGETSLEQPEEGRQEEIDFVNKVSEQLDVYRMELEEERAKSKELENHSYTLQEELEKAHEALYTTGQTLDDTTAELHSKETELTQIKEEVSVKDQEIEAMKQQILNLEELAKELNATKDQLTTAKTKIVKQEHTLTEKDTRLTEVQHQYDDITGQLESANSKLQDFSVDISHLTKDLDLERTKVKKCEKEMAQVDGKFKSTAEELNQSKLTLEEKVKSLQLARKQLKNARDRNLDLEKEVEKLQVTRERLQQSEAENRTLKGFLASKTSLMEKKRQEIREMNTKMEALELKDQKRAIILASVLEKTAKLQQAKMSTTSIHSPQKALQRSYSAPHIMPDIAEELATPVAYNKRKACTTGARKPWTTGPPPDKHRNKSRKKLKKAKTLPRLPPLTTPKEKKAFILPTTTEIREMNKSQDVQFVDHSHSNPECPCTMCKLQGDTVLSSSLPASKLAGFGRLAREHDDLKEIEMSKKIRQGDRVIVQIKQTIYDLEPKKITGTAKYIGKVDSEYIDNRIYVGVKLDEPVGNSDGLYKGKRYFSCTAKHGRMVRITDVLGVLQTKSATYQFKPLFSPNQPGPFSMNGNISKSLMTAT